MINAWDAMKHGDRFEVTTLAATNQKDHVIIRIHDYGSGVDDKIKGEIFKPYYTTKRHGTGLGLPMSQYIVEQLHGGKLEFRSEKNKYTQFDIILKNN
jgi:signal transduction histidine kinase